jgi:hypothetical protein
MSAYTPAIGGIQPDSIEAANAVYDALARLSVTAPDIGRHPAMIKARSAAYDRLIKMSEAF